MKLEKKINILVLILLVIFLLGVLFQQILTKETLEEENTIENIVVEETDFVENAPEKKILTKEELLTFLNEYNYSVSEAYQMPEVLSNYNDIVMLEKENNKIYYVSYYSNGYAQDKFSKYLKEYNLKFEDTTNDYYNFNSILIETKENGYIELCLVDNVIFIFSGEEIISLKDFIITDK